MSLRSLSGDDSGAGTDKISDTCCASGIKRKWPGARFLPGIEVLGVVDLLGFIVLDA